MNKRTVVIVLHSSPVTFGVGVILGVGVTFAVVAERGDSSEKRKKSFLLYL